MSSHLQNRLYTPRGYAEKRIRYSYRKRTRALKKVKHHLLSGKTIPPGFRPQEKGPSRSFETTPVFVSYWCISQLQFEYRSFFSVRDPFADQIQKRAKPDPQNETHDVHPRIVDIAFSHMEEILDGFDRACQEEREQIQDPAVFSFSPPQRHIKSHRQEDQKIAEELDEYAVFEISLLDERPVYGKSAFQRFQVQTAVSEVTVSLQYEEIRQKHQIQQREHDTRTEETSSETAPYVRRIPFLMGKQPDHDRDHRATAPHQDDLKTPLIIHVPEKRPPSVVKVCEEKEQHIGQKTECL